MIIRYRKEYRDGEGVPHPWRHSNIEEYYNNPLSDQYDKNDLGIGDRWNSWLGVYNLVKLNKMEHRIQCMRKQFPESILFKFSQTDFISDEEFYSDVDDFKWFTPKEYAVLESSAHSNSFKDRARTYPFIFVNHIPSLPYLWLEDQPLYIEPTSPEVEHDLRSLFSDYISVHVRRYHGICYTDEDLIELTDELKEQYKNEAFRNNSGSWRYVKDKDHFEYMNTFSNDQMFYVATDLDDKYYLSNWKKQFPGRIVTGRDVYSQFMDILSSHHGRDFVNDNARLIYQMIDFFALAYSKQIVSGRYDNSSVSSYAVAAKRFGNNHINSFVVSD